MLLFNSLRVLTHNFSPLNAALVIHQICNGVIMNEVKSISVYAVNATVYKDVTPTGKDKYIIKINNNAVDALDRVQRCHDYDQVCLCHLA